MYEANADMLHLLQKNVGLAHTPQSVPVLQKW